MDEILAELKNRVLLLEWLVSKKMRNFVEISTVFSQYHADPKSVLALVHQDGFGTPEEVAYTRA